TRSRQYSRQRNGDSRRARRALVAHHPANAGREPAARLRGMRGWPAAGGLRRQTTDGHVYRHAASGFASCAGCACPVVFNPRRVRLRTAVRNSPCVTRKQTEPESRPEGISTRIAVGFEKAITVFSGGLGICVHTGLADRGRLVPAQFHFAAEDGPRL